MGSGDQVRNGWALNGAAGWLERRRQAREDGAVLTIKPRAYYAGTHVLQRARIARLRRGGNGTAAWQGVRLFGYHRVARGYDELALMPDMFRRQMEALLHTGVQPITLAR